MSLRFWYYDAHVWSPHSAGLRLGYIGEIKEQGYPIPLQQSLQCWKKIMRQCKHSLFGELKDNKAALLRQLYRQSLMETVAEDGDPKFSVADEILFVIPNPRKCSSGEASHMFWRVLIFTPLIHDFINYVCLIVPKTKHLSEVLPLVFGTFHRDRTKYQFFFNHLVTNSVFLQWNQAGRDLIDLTS